MKRILFGLFLGILVHMVYLDLILIDQHYIVENCPLEEKPDSKGDLNCVKYANETPERFKGKYFGFYRLFHWKHVITGPYRME